MSKIKTNLFLLILAIAFLAPLSSFSSEFTVNSTEDKSDTLPGDNDCIANLDAGGTGCTLRAAIQETNALGGTNTITLPNGTFTLTGNPNEDNAAEGDLDILGGDLTIRGTNARDTIVSGAGIDRVFHARLNADVIFENLTIRDGDISEGNGGGVLIDGGNTVFENTSIIHNKNSSLGSNPAQGDGAGIFIFSGSLTVNNSNISYNITPEQTGGGIYARNPTVVTISNSTISHNKAPSQDAGGILVSGETTISDSTITNNEADDFGGIDKTGQLTLSNSIVANNSAISMAPNCGGSFITLKGYNIIGDNTDCNLQGDDGTNQIGTALNPIDPLLGPLQDNGGPTDTHALLTGSPAIDQGDDQNCPDTDQRGVARDDVHCDIGAYEANCGDAILQGTETCDDGNTTDGDGCSSSCQLESGTNNNNNNGSTGSGGCGIARGGASHSNVIGLSAVLFGLGLLFRWRKV